MINPNQLGRRVGFPASASQWMLVGLRGAAVGGPIDPSTIAGLKLWLKADAEGLTNGAGLGTWHDNSGNGADFPGSATFYFTNVVNGKPVVRYDGSTSRTTNATSTIVTGNYTIFTVAQAASISAGSHCIFASGSGGGEEVIIRRDATDLSHYHYGSGYVSVTETGGIVAGEWNLITADFNGTNIHMWRNGTLKGTTGVTTSPLIGLIDSVGWDRMASSGAGSDYWNGDIAEVLIYDSALSITDRGNVETYLKTKYALP